MTEYNRYRNVTGQRLLKGLFYEMVKADKSSVVYTLKNWDHCGFPSLYRLYLEADDPTEYSFAIACLDGWDHWELLTQCGWFAPFVSKWRKELEVRTKARALLAIKALAADPKTKESYQANKYIMNYNKPTGRSAGRPSKDDIQKEAQRMAQEATNLDEDFQRISGTSGIN